MIASIKAEFLKLWTIRSTYVILLFSLVLLGVFAFYAEGIQAGYTVSNSDKLANLIKAAAANLSGFGALVGLLSVTHEYRYFTIMYTLTSSKSRTRILLAKMLVATAFSIVFTIFVVVFAVAMMYLGLEIKGLSLVHQVVPADIWWKVLFTGWGYCMFATIIAFLIRQQVGSIVVFMFVPGIVESLVGLLLKGNKVYLPFTALQQVTQPEVLGLTNPLNPTRAALTASVYLLLGGLVAWFMFMRRDAN